MQEASLSLGLFVETPSSRQGYPELAQKARGLFGTTVVSYLVWWRPQGWWDSGRAKPSSHPSSC